MSLRRVIAVARKSLLRFKNDHRTLAFVILVPLLTILIFGYTFGGGAKNVPVHIVNNDEGILLDGPTEPPTMLSDTIIENIDGEVLDIKTSSDVSEAEQQVEDGKAWAAIVFPTNYSNTVFEHMQASGQATGDSTDPSPANITVILDNSDPNIGGTVLKAINEAMASGTDDLSEQLGFPSIEAPMETSVTYKYGSDQLKPVDDSAPGMIAFVIMMITVLITVMTFVEEKTINTLDRLLASPLREIEIVLGTAAAFAVLGIIQSGVLLATTAFVFDVRIVGGFDHVLIALFFVVLLAIGHQGLGMLLSAGAKNQLQAIQLIPLILFPSIMLTGVFWPVESIPKAVQPLSDFIPLTYGVDALRSVMLRGWGLDNPILLLDLGVLVLFSVVTLGLSIMMLRVRK